MIPKHFLESVRYSPTATTALPFAPPLLERIPIWLVSIDAGEIQLGKMDVNENK